MIVHKRKTFNGARTVCGKRVKPPETALNGKAYARVLVKWFGYRICRKCWGAK